MGKEKMQIKDMRLSILNNIRSDLQMDLKISKDIDIQLIGSQNIEDFSHFFLNTKMGNNVRKIPEKEFKQIRFSEDHFLHKPILNHLHTPPRSTYSANKRSASYHTAKFQKLNLTSIIEQKEKRTSLRTNIGESNEQIGALSQENGQLQKILDMATFEQYEKVIQVLQLRQRCLNIDQQLKILWANDKLLKKKVQFYETKSKFVCSHSSFHQSEEKDPIEIIQIQERSHRSQSTKQQKSVAPSFQDSQFKHFSRLGEPTFMGSTMQKKPNKRQLIKHGTVEIMYDVNKQGNRTNDDDITLGQDKFQKVNKIAPDLFIQLPQSQQKSNDFKKTKPAQSDQYKQSEGYLHPNTNNGTSTVDKVPTPYFKLHTPAKLLSKSNMTFNSQSKMNQSQLSISNGQDRPNILTPSTDKLSNDSSEQSALMNAKNLGLDGQLLNNRRNFRSQSLVHEFQQQKIKQQSMNKQWFQVRMFQKLKDKMRDQKHTCSNQMDRIMDNMSMNQLIIIDRDDLQHREMEMLLVQRLNIYFKKDNSSQGMTTMKSFQNLIAKKLLPSKQYYTPSIAFLYQDSSYPQQQQKLDKILKKQKKQCHFYVNQNLVVREFKQVNIVELSNQVDYCELEMKVTMEQYQKSQVERIKSRNHYYISSKNFTQFNIYFDSLQKQLTDQRLQIDLFPVKSNQTNQDTQECGSLFKLQYLESKKSFCMLDYDEWVKNRLRTILQTQKIRQDYLFQCQLSIFLESDGELLNKFLQLDKEKLMLKIDSDYDDSSLLSDQVRSLYSSSMVSADNKSVNSSYDDLNFNNVHNINVVHSNFDPSSILGRVIINKNADWEIFKILSQSKMDKIKNKIRLNPNEKSNLRENLIESRIKTIRRNAIEALEYGNSHKNIFKVDSEDSSDLDSNMSFKQTIKYMYVERMQEFLNVDIKRKPQKDTQKRFKMLSSPTERELLAFSRQDFIKDTSRQKNYFNNVDVDKVYGFRYNQLADQEGSPTRSELSMTQTEGTDKPIKKIRKKKGNGIIKLLNGMPLSLDDEPIDLHCNLLNGRPKERALQNQKIIQKYYDDVRRDLRDMQYNENKIIKYRRSECLNEIELDADHGRYLRQLQKLKLKKYTIIREKQSAFSTDVTKFNDKKYRTPFKDYYIRNFNAHIQANEIEKFQNLKQKHQKHPFVGFKGQQFALNFRLQSHGSFKQLRELRQEISSINETIEDINMYRKSQNDDGYPIYLIFEVIHVYRQREQDIRENNNMIACKLAMTVQRMQEIDLEQKQKKKSEKLISFSD